MFKVTFPTTTIICTCAAEAAQVIHEERANGPLFVTVKLTTPSYEGMVETARETGLWSLRDTAQEFDGKWVAEAAV